MLKEGPLYYVLDETKSMPSKATVAALQISVRYTTKKDHIFR